jgi:hypothetical protein
LSTSIHNVAISSDGTHIVAAGIDNMVYKFTNGPDAFPDDPDEWDDSDGDGVGDNEDKFPDDPKRAFDTDGDGIANYDENFLMERIAEEDEWLFILLIAFSILIVMKLVQRRMPEVEI